MTPLIVHAGRPGKQQHDVIGLGVLRRPSGICFDDAGRLYASGVEGVARFVQSSAGLWHLDGFLCYSVHAEDVAADIKVVVLPVAPSDVAFAHGMFVVSAHGHVNGELVQGLWVLDGATGALLKHIDTGAHGMVSPNYLALRMMP